MSWSVINVDKQLRPCKKCGYTMSTAHVYNYTAPEGTAQKYRITCICGLTTNTFHDLDFTINQWNGTQLGLVDAPNGGARTNYDVVCYKCGEKDIQSMYWVNSNNRNIIEMIGSYKDEESHYCNNCKEHVRLIYETSYRREA